MTMKIRHEVRHAPTDPDASRIYRARIVGFGTVRGHLTLRWQIYTPRTRKPKK